MKSGKPAIRVAAWLCIAAMFCALIPMNPRAARAERSVVLPEACLGIEYSTVISYDSGISVELDEGAVLPQGMTLADGVLVGLPEETGDFVIPVTFTSGETQSAASLSLHISSIRILSESLPPVKAGEPYSAVIGAMYPPYDPEDPESLPVSFEIDEEKGSLPAGLTLNAESGEISGNAEAFTEPAEVTIRMTRGEEVTEKLLILYPAEEAVHVYLAACPAAFVAGEVPEFRVLVTGGSGNYEYSISGDEVEKLDDETCCWNDSELVLRLNAAPEHSLEWTVDVWDTENEENLAELVIKSSRIKPITVNTIDLTGDVGAEFNKQLDVSGGKTLKFTLESGSLPEGLTLAANGVISGTPAAAGDFMICIRVEDVEFPGLVAFATLSGTIREAAGMSLSPDTVEKDIVSVECTVTGGTAPYTAEIVSYADTVLSPTITAVTENRFTFEAEQGSTGEIVIRVTDGTGLTLEKTYTLDSTPASVPFEISVEKLPKGKVGEEYSCDPFSANEDCNVKVTGLPDGIIADENGALSGIPTECGTFTLVFKAESLVSGSEASVEENLTILGDAGIEGVEAVKGIHEITYVKADKQYVLKMKNDASKAVFNVYTADPGAKIEVSSGDVDGRQITMKAGETMTLTVTCSDGTVSEYSFKATVEAATITIEGAPSSVEVGEKFTLTVKPEPSDAWIGPVTWDYKGGFSHDGDNPAEFKALKAGSYTISAQTRDVLGKTITAQIVVKVTAEEEDPTPAPKKTTAPSATIKPNILPENKTKTTPKPTQTPKVTTEPTQEPTTEPTPSATPTPSPTATLSPEEEPTPEASEPENQSKKLPGWFWPLLAGAIILIPSGIVVLIAEIKARRDAPIVDEEEITFDDEEPEGEEEDAPNDFDDD